MGTLANRPGVVLGIDFGQRRIGLATGNELTGTATALQTIVHAGDPFEQLDRVIRDWRPDRIVLGLPLAADGSESKLSRSARRFAGQLKQRHPGIAFELHDERFSSRQADSQFVDARRSGQARRRDARKLDGIAAAIILE
ncbi:MAG: Holliday junction resolvase RuvX, partial [Xanthomonadaceae bacterium]|nr:Holliday junction resolvase RuvX [Xanthomonadaceae bacterium]